MGTGTSTRADAPVRLGWRRRQEDDPEHPGTTVRRNAKVAPTESAAARLAAHERDLSVSRAAERRGQVPEHTSASWAASSELLQPSCYSRRKHLYPP